MGLVTIGVGQPGSRPAGTQSWELRQGLGLSIPVFSRSSLSRYRQLETSEVLSCGGVREGEGGALKCHLALLPVSPLVPTSLLPLCSTHIDLNFFKCLFIFERETELSGGGADRERRQNPKQALSCQHKA